MRMRQSFATILIGKNVLLREGLSRILRTANFRIQASASCADDLIPSSLQRYQPLFLIIRTGDDFDFTVEQIELVRAQYPNGRIAIVADHYRPTELVLAFQAGANGYLVDVTTCDAFINSIELVMMGQMIFPPALLSFVRDTGCGPRGETEPRYEGDRSTLFKNEHSTVEHAAAPHLSPREQSILRCLIEGDSNKRIARKIDIAESTVKVHVKAILRKIRVQNRTQAAIWAMNNGSLARSADKGTLPEIAEVDTPLASSNGLIGEVPAPLRIAPVTK
ncbi:response regulator transcription factor [Bradyrhizobium neotropicale]|uniref:LuxR C-terminal-related transcriptional regulator n=1 Tax=Bradyrhizobium neotropicale TaxID=1497615 RepID=UPI001AD6238D|nr:response regulator transcription factor [Bradyrhizobium neotropicale]MBO4227698.1 DNA-binding response regulator [Bradyrhizobium neotropicale]